MPAARPWSRRRGPARRRIPARPPRPSWRGPPAPVGRDRIAEQAPAVEVVKNDLRARCRIAQLEPGAGGRVSNLEVGLDEELRVARGETDQGDAAARRAEAPGSPGCPRARRSRARRSASWSSFRCRDRSPSPATSPAGRRRRKTPAPRRWCRPRRRPARRSCARTPVVRAPERDLTHLRRQRRQRRAVGREGDRVDRPQRRAELRELASRCRWRGGAPSGARRAASRSPVGESVTCQPVSGPSVWQRT